LGFSKQYRGVFFMKKWKRVGLITVASFLLYTSWCATPVASEEQKNGSKVVYFSGHYESADPEREGAASAIGIRERIYNDGILWELWTKRKSHDKFVYSNANVPLEKRQDHALSLDGLVFVEIHHDSLFKSDRDRKNFINKGFSIYFSNQNAFGDESLRLAVSIGREFVKQGFTPTKYYTLPGRTRGKTPVSLDEGVYLADNLYVLNRAKMPSVLVECGNIADPEEHELMVQNPVHERLAKSISDGVTAYLTKRQ